MRRDEAAYELGDVGLRVMAGNIEREIAADWNGAGKSALDIAPPGAIAGRTEFCS